MTLSKINSEGNKQKATMKIPKQIIKSKIMTTAIDSALTTHKSFKGKFKAKNEKILL